jgi:hypothetical protein
MPLRAISAELLASARGRSLESAKAAKAAPRSSMAKRLSRQKPKGGRMPLRAISAELAAHSFLNENGRPSQHRPSSRCWISEAHG